MNELKNKIETNLEDKISGIYCIENLVNGKKYIGQSYNIKWRWMKHRCELRGNRHHDRHLQYAWNKYGEDNFKFYVLEFCEEKDLNEKEIFWINKLDTYNSGYNMDTGGKGIRGYKHTEDEILKMRMIQNPEPIVQLDLEGNYINTFISTGEAGDYLGKKSVCGIKRCCEKNKYKQAYGYIWVYEKDYLNNNVDWDYYFEKPSNKAKVVFQYDTNMNFIQEYESVNQAASAVGAFGSDICNVCKGKRVTAAGYIWIFKDNPELYYEGKKKREEENLKKKLSKQRNILQYDRNGNFIKEYTNQELTDNGWNVHTIQSCCTGYIKTYKNYIWKYKEEQTA